MNISDRINTFKELGSRLLADSKPGVSSSLNRTIENAKDQNPWFVPENIRFAIDAIANSWLQEEVLYRWVKKYPENFFNPESPKTIGVIMAGNIPLVGFHDLLCVLITGNRFLGKSSSKDGDLMTEITKLIYEINPDFQNFISITNEKIFGFDAVIATGSNNTFRYFEFYFKNFPSIIRKHRNSIAVLKGDETRDEYQKLGDDIFTYFGLGCRNVSKIFTPVGFDFIPLIDSFAKWQFLSLNYKYANNYEYNKALLLMNGMKHFDNGFLLIRPEESIGSPVSVLHYKSYSDIGEVKTYIHENKEEIQCIVARDEIIEGSIPFGKSQNPAIDDYADGIDTIKFLGSLKTTN